MEKTAFEAVLAAVRAQKPNVFPMQDTLKAAIANQYLTSMQLGILVDEFKPNVFPMLDVVKAAAPKLVDPQNGVSISAKFQPNVFPAQEAAKVIAEQKAD